jgi:hypothetical protein
MRMWGRKPCACLFAGADVCSSSLRACALACGCQAGYACAAGSTSPTAATCPTGRYSLAGADVCTQCEAGRFGATTALPSAVCSGLCAPGQWSGLGVTACSPCSGGYYGSGGSTSTTCTGLCEAGYSCPAGSSVSTASICPTGQWSAAGAALCSACAAGVCSAGCVPLAGMGGPGGSPVPLAPCAARRGCACARVPGGVDPSCVQENSGLSKV